MAIIKEEVWYLPALNIQNNQTDSTYGCLRMLLTSLGCSCMLIGMKVSINISEEMYGKIKGLSEESLRPLALEIVYWLQKGLSSEGVKSGDKVPSQTRNKTKKEVDSREDILDELLDSGKVSKGTQNIDGFKTYFK